MSGCVNSFLMILFRNFVLSLWAGGLVFFFSPQAPAYMGNVCLHPLEQMALFSGGAKGNKSSYKSQIRRLNKSIRAIDRRIDKQKDKLKEATDTLGNSLSGRRLGDDSDDVADSVTGYIQDEQNGWDCQELLEANNFLYPPSFLPGIFGSLLPLIWETAPVYAVASPEDRRKGTVAYQQSARENTCKKSGGTVTSTGPRGSGGKTCDCSGFGKGARSDGNWSCVCPFRPGVSLPCKQVKKIKEARKKRLEEEKRRASEKASDQRLKELAKSRKKRLEEERRQAREEARDKGLAELSKSRKKKRLKKCREDYSSFDYIQLDKSGKDCLCRERGWRRGVWLSCGKQKEKKQSIKTCREIYGSSVTELKPTPEGPQCYCGTQFCDKKKAADEERRQAREEARDKGLAELSKSRKKKRLKKCREDYSSFDYIQLDKSGKGCLCRERSWKNGLWLSCGKQKEKKQSIKTCREIYGSSVTELKPTPEGPQCYCGTQFCDKKKAADEERRRVREEARDKGLAELSKSRKKKRLKKCKEDYSSFDYVQLDKSGKDCLCRERSWKNGLWLSCGKQKEKKQSIKTCREIYGSSVTELKPTPEGPQCYCGTQFCDKKKAADEERRRVREEARDKGLAELSKSRKKKRLKKCREDYSSFDYIQLDKSGKGCLCRERGWRRGVWLSCGKEQQKEKEKENQTRCLNQYGKHLKNGVKKITFKRGRCYCDNKLCGSLGDPATPPAPVGPEEPPIIVPDPADEKSPNKQCREKYTGLKVVGAKKNGDVLECTCYHNKKKDSCENIKKLIQATPDSALPVIVPDPVDEKSPNKQCREKYTGLKVVGARKNGDVLECTCYHNKKKDSCENIKKLIQATPDPDLPIPVGEGSGAGDEPPGEGDAVEEVVKDTKEPCKRWQKKKYFKRKGRVKDRAFCSAFASSKKDCGDAFEDIKDQIEKLRKLKVRQKKLEKSLSEWEDKKFDAQFSDDEDEDDTEASRFCTKCLADLRKATGPTGWQRFGSGLSVALGAGLSIFGLREARRAQNSTNELLALQGMPAENNFGYSMAGLSLGYPFVAKGLHGLTHGNTSNFACNRQASPYPHPYPTYPVF